MLCVGLLGGFFGGAFIAENMDAVFVISHDESEGFFGVLYVYVEAFLLIFEF